MTKERPTPRRLLRGPLAAAALAFAIAAPAAAAAPQRTPAEHAARSDSDARTDANASAQDRRQDAQSSRETGTHTRRVVVRNGRTVVDEETRDGQPVRRRGARGLPGARGAAPGLGGTFDPEAEIERMMREMRAELRREMPHASPGGAGARGGAGGPTVDRARQASSHTRRVVVRNGRTVVDEETRDGTPVRGRRGRRGAPNAPRAGGAELEIQRMIRDLEMERSRPARSRAGGPTPRRLEPLRPTPSRPAPLRPLRRGASPAPLRPPGVTGGR